MLSLTSLLEPFNVIDQKLTSLLDSYPFTSTLIATPPSKVITFIIIFSFIFLLTYESIYWFGIYLDLWEYHAKDIFTEVPVHCAHIYVRVNIVDNEQLGRLREYYLLKKKLKYQVLYWNQLNQLGSEVFKIKKFIKYHFEFSPEDFEMNEEPEFGSTVKHLRQKVARMVNGSRVYSEFILDKSTEDVNAVQEGVATTTGASVIEGTVSKTLPPSTNSSNSGLGITEKNVLLFKSDANEVGLAKDKEYLVKCGIETGNIVDCILVV